MALRCLKAALNADRDASGGTAGAGGQCRTMLFYMTEEGQEGRGQSEAPAGLAI